MTKMEARFQVDEKVFTYFGGGPWPFKCRIIRIIEEEYGFFTKKKRPVYHLQIADQEWAFSRYEFELGKTQSEVYRN